MLLVDAANVVGSRPNGWWRDRPGAARQLVESIRAAVGSGRISGPVVVVVEGQARLGAEEGSVDGVEVVHAPASGDDTLVDIARGAGDRDVVLVSADRGLRSRAAALGATAVGPAWLLDRIDGGRASP